LADSKVLSGLSLSIITNNYKVSDDCLSIRINDAIYHHNGASYVKDTIVNIALTTTTTTDPATKAVTTTSSPV